MQFAKEPTHEYESKSDILHPVPELIFMYGFPASGKTIYAKSLVINNPDKKYVYLGADKIREELYRSQDIFGDSNEIYQVLLQRMLNNLRQGRNVIYDACNLFRSFRMDYLTEIEKAADIVCTKTLIRMNTTRDTCLQNHQNRNRNFDIQNIQHYFSLNQAPTIDEGWDDILDVPDNKLDSLRFHIIHNKYAGKELKQKETEIAEYLRMQGHSVTTTYEHARFSKYQESQKEYDFQFDMINKADYVIIMRIHRINDTRNYITGYACGKEKPIIAIDCDGWPYEHFVAISCSSSAFYTYTSTTLRRGRFESS